jgi:hypothetical protein
MFTAELAGGTTTGGDTGGPAVIDELADCSVCWRLAGLVTSCCTIPTHGTPPWVVSAVAGAANGLNNGTARYAPAVPMAIMTSRFVVRDIVFSSLSAPEPVGHARLACEFTEQSILKFSDATIAALPNRCQGEAVPSPHRYPPRNKLVFGLTPPGISVLE